MDPISLITSAIAVGAAFTLGETTSQAIKDSYHGLKWLIEQRFGPDSRLLKVTEALELDPDSERLREQLAEASATVRAHEFDELIKAARKLLDIAREQGNQDAKFVTQIMGDVQGFVQSNYGHITMTFNQSKGPGETETNS